MDDVTIEVLPNNSMTLATSIHDSIINTGSGNQKMFTSTNTDGTTLPQTTENTDKIISDAVTYYILLIVNVCLNGIVSTFGIVANCLNIIVFIRLGVFSEYGTAGIFGLAVSDLICMVFTLWQSIGEALMMVDLQQLSWNVFDIVSLTAGWPRSIFSLIARCHTSYVSFERCICVVFPFNVKTWLTPKRTLMIMAFIAVLIIGLFIPIYVSLPLRHVTDPETNLTILEVVVDKELDDVIQASLRYVIAYGLHIMSVLIVLVCTTITSYRVILSRSWRDSLNKTTEESTISSSLSPSSHRKKNNEKSSNKNNNNNNSKNNKNKNKNHNERGKTCNSNSETTTITTITTINTPSSSSSSSTSKTKQNKEERLVKIIMSTSIIFLTAYLPFFVYMIITTINIDFSFRGKFQNFSRVFYSFIYLVENVSSSINIVVYYRLSLRFKHELDAMLGWKESKSKK